MTRLALLLALLLAPLAVAAQTSEAPAPEAVRTLLEVSGSRDAYAQGISLALDGMGAGNPQMERLRPVFEEFYATYASWDDVEPEFVQLYRDLFSANEVEALTAWYRTPIGERFREVQPELQRRSMEIGQRMVMEHQAELQTMIQEAIQGGALAPNGQ